MPLTTIVANRGQESEEEAAPLALRIDNGHQRMLAVDVIHVIHSQRLLRCFLWDPNPVGARMILRAILRWE